MTKKDYQLIATSLKESFERLDLTFLQKQELVSNLAKKLAHENNRFNWDKFAKATSLEPTI